MERRILIGHAAKMAAVLAAAKIFILIVARLLGAAWVVSPITGIAMIMAAFMVMLYAAISVRRLAPDGDGFLFSRAMFHLVLVFGLGNFIYTLSSIVLFHVIDPGLGEAVIEPSIEIIRKVLESNGMSPEEVDTQVTQMRAAGSPYTPAGQLQGWLTSLVPATVGCAIFGFLLRRRSPPPPA